MSQLLVSCFSTSQGFPIHRYNTYNVFLFWNHNSVLWSNTPILCFYIEPNLSLRIWLWGVDLPHVFKPYLLECGTLNPPPLTHTQERTSGVWLDSVDVIVCGPTNLGYTLTPSQNLGWDYDDDWSDKGHAIGVEKTEGIENEWFCIKDSPGFFTTVEKLLDMDKSEDGVIMFAANASSTGTSTK